MALAGPQRNADGFTALHLACRLGDLPKVQQLVREFPYLLNAPDAHDATPLYYAALVGAEEICRFLLDSGARCDPDTHDSERIYYVALTSKLRRMLRSYHLTAATRDPFLELVRRSFGDREFADVRCQLQSGKELFVHRVMLATRCPKLLPCVFESMTTPGTLELVPDASFFGARETTIQLVLKFLYTGQLETQSYEDSLDVGALASAWGLNELEQFMKTQISATENFQRGRVLGGTEERRGGTGNLRLCYRAEDALRDDLKELARRVAKGDPYVTQFSDCFVRVVKNNGLPSEVAKATDEGVTPFSLHRSFLCAHSEYFRGALLGEFSESKSSTVELLDTTSGVFEHVIEWMYSDHWTELPDPEEALEIVELASRLMIPRLAIAASNVLGPYIDNDNVVGCFRFAQLHALQRLERSCVKHVALNVNEICSSETSGFRDLIREELRAIAQRGDVNVRDVPLVADIRNVLNEHYGNLSEEDEEDCDEHDKVDVETEDRIDVQATERGAAPTIVERRRLKAERTLRHQALDCIVAEALQAEHDMQTASSQ